LAGLSSLSASSGVVIDSKPLSAANSVPGNLVLVPSVEWPTVVTQANSPGVGETSATYSSGTAYAGYFNTELCYAYHYDGVEANRYFYPAATASSRSCSGKTGGKSGESQSLWSGNFLNWVTMQSIDTFRLALTGGYRVHRPGDGTPPNVSITVATASGYTTASKATSEMPNVTYLEKANSDRWDDNYTKLRRLTSANAVAGATPVPASITSSFRARIASLRNQMWFVPNANIGLGSAFSFSDPHPLSLPITNGSQTVAGDTAAVTAIPYNPAYHNFSVTANTTYVDGNSCGTYETGCSGPTTVAACQNSNNPYFNTSNGNCYRNSNSTTGGLANNCPSGSQLPTSSGTGKTCSGIYTHTNYGINQVYAVSIRVQVCDGSLDTRDICTKYGNYYKPEGLLQANAKKTRYSLFSYLTETGQVRQGGVMRARQKLISPVSVSEQDGSEKLYPDRSRRIANIDNPEWDPVTGVFINDPDNIDSAATGSNIGACTTGTVAPDGSGCSVKYSGVINYLNRFGQINTGRPTLKAYDNLSEMYYTALLYLRGEANKSAFSSLAPLANTDLNNTGSLGKYQNADGLPVIEDWYKTGANTAARKWNALPAISVGADGDPILYQCQTNVVLGIGDTHTNSEEDAYSSDSVANAVTWRTYTEGNSASRMNVAGLAYWAHLNDIRPDVPNTLLSTSPARAKGQSISTYWVDVVEQNDLYAKTTNQYYNATKYGGFTIPDSSYDANGNAGRPAATWFSSNTSVWTSATQTVKAQTGLGGTGDYYLPNNMYLANNGQAMIQGLNAAFQRIANNSSGSGSSFASNSTKLENGSYTYQAKYTSSTWGGQLVASTVSTASGNLTDVWDAAVWLAGSATSNDYSKRNLLYNNAGTLSKLISNWSNYTVLSSPTVVKPSGLSSITDDQMKYLLGDRSGERQYGGSLRNRSGMLGDIINSQPVYVGAPSVGLYSKDSSYSAYLATKLSRTPIVYVGANDGFLHAFDASTGTNAGREVFAFMPTASMAVLKQSDASSNIYPNWDSNYEHAYSMDGELTVSDVKVGNAGTAADWKTILVGTMGRGGKSVFALDVSDPASPTLLWEKSAGDISTLGNSIGKPIIAKVADGDWRVFLGNGPNSSAGGSVMIALNVQTGAQSGSISGGTGDDNGLGPVNVWDSDKDGNYDTVYAGDMAGALWKFSIGGSAKKLFTARSDASAVQPITVAPLVARNPSKPTETWAFFGTGRYLSLIDISESANQAVQSWYGVIDSDAEVARSTLKQVEIVYQDSVGRVIESSTAAGLNGWYINLQSPEEAAGTVAARGERMVVPNFFQGLTLIGTSRFPASTDPCSPSGQGFTMAINPFTGGRLKDAFFDANGSGAVGDSGDYYGGNTGVPYSGIGYSSGPNNPIFIGSYMYTSLDDGTARKTVTNSGGSAVKRVSWREMLNVE
jgi:type IV pilus assembly protein PilY1